MADTTRGWWPDLNCDDCGEKGVSFKHWGFLTKNKLKKLCGPCMKKRSEGDNETKENDSLHNKIHRISTP